MDASFAAHDSDGQVTVTWDPDAYRTPVVVVERDGEHVSIHTNGHNYVQRPGEEDHDLAHGEAHLFNQPAGEHAYRLCECAEYDARTAEVTVGDCSAPVSVVVG